MLPRVAGANLRVLGMQKSELVARREQNLLLHREEREWTDVLAVTDFHLDDNATSACESPRRFDVGCSGREGSPLDRPPMLVLLQDHVPVAGWKAPIASTPEVWKLF